MLEQSRSQAAPHQQSIPAISSRYCSHLYAVPVYVEGGCHLDAQLHTQLLVLLVAVQLHDSHALHTAVDLDQLRVDELAGAAPLRGQGWAGV